MTPLHLHPLAATDFGRVAHIQVAPDQVKFSGTVAEAFEAAEDGVDHVLLFVVDILNEEATLFVQNDVVKSVAEKSFDASVDGDTVVLPGIMSRKKQIIPNLTV